MCAMLFFFFNWKHFSFYPTLALLQNSRRSEAVNSAVSKVNRGLYLDDLRLTFLSTLFKKKSGLALNGTFLGRT